MACASVGVVSSCGVKGSEPGRSGSSGEGSRAQFPMPCGCAGMKSVVLEQLLFYSEYGLNRLFLPPRKALLFFLT